MKFELATAEKVEQPLRLAIEISSGEAQLNVVDQQGHKKYPLIGIRSDGTFVSYSMDAIKKKADGFKVNNIGQVVYYCNDGVSLNRTAQV